MDPVSAIGLAASVLQLGTFLVGSMGTMKTIRDGLRTGNADLQRIERGLADHRQTLHWLSTICSQTPSPSLEEKQLLDQLQASIKQSEEDVVGISKVLSKVRNPTIFKGKKLGLAEQSVRLLVKREELQKYIDVLDSHIALFTFFLTQLSRLESSIAFAATQSLIRGRFDTLLPQVSHVFNSVERLDRLLLPTNASPKSKTADYVIALHERQLPWTPLPSISLVSHKSSWFTHQETRSLFGSLNVSRSNHTTHYRKRNRKGGVENAWSDNEFFFCFQPSSWISKYMIELRVKWFQSNGSVMHIALTPVCHRMCMDVEVVRALGMNICRNCIINSQDPCTCDEEKYPHPDPKAVQRFLECGRLIGSDSIYRHRYGCYHRLHILKEVLIALEKTDCRWLRECHQICQLLLDHGAKATRECYQLSERSQWRLCYQSSERHGARSINMSRDNWMSYSIGHLLLSHNPSLATGSNFFISTFTFDRDSRVPEQTLPPLCNLIRLPDSVPIIQAEFTKLVDIFDPEFKLERCLLAFMGHFSSDFKMITDEYMSTWATGKRHDLVSINHVCLELRADSTSSWVKRLFRSLLRVGNLEMIRRFLSSVPDFDFDPGYDYVLLAAASKHREIFYEIFPLIKAMDPFPFFHSLQEEVVWSKFHDLEFREAYFSKAQLEDSKRGIQPSRYMLEAIHHRATESPKFLECYRLTVDALIQHGHCSRTDRGILGVEIRDAVIFSAASHLIPLYNTLQIIPQHSLFLESEVDGERGLLENHQWRMSPIQEEHIRKFYIGLTPLLFALDTGLLEVAKVLVNAGAQIQRRASCGVTPLELAQRNLAAKHPRVLPKPSYINWAMPKIPFERDEEMLIVLKDALQARGEKIIGNLNEEAERAAGEENQLAAENRGSILSFLRYCLKWFNKPILVFDREFGQMLVDQSIQYTLLILSLGVVTVLGVRDCFRGLDSRALLSFLLTPKALLCLILAVVFLR